MAHWFDTGRRAIFESLAEVCDKIDDDLKAEHEKTRNELEALRSQAAEVGRLAQENQHLRAQLRQLQPSHHAPQTPKNPQQPLASQPPLDRSRLLGHNKKHIQLLTPQSANQLQRSVSPLVATASDDDVDWKREAAKNAAKYGRIRTELETAKELLVKRRDETTNWKTYAESLEKKVAALEAKHEAHGAHDEDPTRKTLDLRAEVVSGAIADENDYGGYPRDTTSKMQADSRARSSTPLGSTAARMPSSPSGNRRHAEAQEDCCPTQSNSSEGDQELSDMTLPDLPRQGNLPLEPKIKQEPSSDIPTVVLERPVRKRKRLDTEHQQPSPTRVKYEDDGSDPVVTADLCDFSPATSVDLDESGTRLDTPRKHIQLEDIRTGVLNPHDPNIFEDAPVRSETGHTFTPTRSLQPLSPNIRMPRPIRPLKKGVGRAVSELAEDGGIYEVPSDQPQALPRTEPKRGRLAGLLNRSAAEPESPLIRQGARFDRVRLAPPDPNWPQAPQPRELPFDKRTRALEDKMLRANTASPGCGTSATRHGSSGSTPAARSKPPSGFRLEDFKINPKFNNGYDYAYTEVVRNKDERACIPGCVDMDCCGKQFRAMALAERGTGPRTPAQLTEDRKLLENYLGDKAYRIFSMTKEEKDEVWLEAKTQELADRIGKHRHRFSRMKSPPGFWRTDFPDTQEQEQDKAAAVRREREMVQQRYREAMRPGGKWVFRDD